MVDAHPIFIKFAIRHRLKKTHFPPRGKCVFLLLRGRPHSALPGRTHLKDLGQRKEHLAEHQFSWCKFG